MPVSQAEGRLEVKVGRANHAAGSRGATLARRRDPWARGSVTAAEQVHFPTGTTASLVAAEAGDGPEPVLAALGLTAMRDRPVIVLCGGAGSGGAAAAGAWVAPAVAAAARRTGASVVDGGTGSGVMAAM